MFEIEETVTIRQTIEELWSFLMDETNDPVWQTTLTETRRLTEGPLSAGSRVLEVRRFLGRRIETVWEMVECDPPRFSSITSVSAPFDWRGTYELEPVDGGTRFTVRGQASPARFFRIAEPVFARLARRELTTNLANLQDLLEAGLDEQTREPAAAAAAS